MCYVPYIKLLEYKVLLGCRRIPVHRKSGVGRRLWNDLETFSICILHLLWVPSLLSESRIITGLDPLLGRLQTGHQWCDHRLSWPFLEHGSSSHLTCCNYICRFSSIFTRRNRLLTGSSRDCLSFLGCLHVTYRERGSEVGLRSSRGRRAAKCSRYPSKTIDLNSTFTYFS